MIDDVLKLSSWIGERSRDDGRFLSDVLLDLFEERGVTTSTLLRATAGFGLRHHLRTDQTLTMSEDPSVVAIAVDRRDRIEPLVPRVAALQGHGLLTVERARMVRDDLVPGPLPRGDGDATKLTIHIGRHERVYGVPAHVAVCDLLHRRGVSGASVLLGVDGTANGRRERARFFDRNADVPAMVLAVGEGSRIQRVLPELGGVLDDLTVTVERVQICKEDGEFLSRPTRLPDRDPNGLGWWQKLTVYTSESHLHDGEPVHRGIIRRLRATAARGATSLRGVWGFHGTTAPHGDRFLQLGRRVPVVTVTVDSPERIQASFDVIDELTREHGLVTCESVPAMMTFSAAHERGGLRLASHPM